MENNEKPVFESGAMEIKLTQHDMAVAVEHWLNSKIMKVPVMVTRLIKNRGNVSTSETFSVVMVEASPTQAAGEDDAQIC